MNRKMLLKIYFENEQEMLPVTYKLKILMRRAIEATLDYEQFFNGAEVSMTFTDNAGIRELNRRFRQIDRETDVLSFPLFDYEGEADEPALDEIRNNLGDIVISLEKAQAQAEEYGHSYEREVAFLCVHSMLHLLGYDHELSEQDDIDMRTRQSEIMKLLGLEVRNA
jgi:probable rRNA maturation factor